jgi:hypothetical protein
MLLSAEPMDGDKIGALPDSEIIALDEVCCPPFVSFKLQPQPDPHRIFVFAFFVDSCLFVA